MLGRVLPGGALVAAALILPEFSVGAGDTGRGAAATDPPDPPSAPGLERTRRVAGEAKGPLAGVRYATVLELRTAPSSAGSLARIAALEPAAASRDATLPQPAPLAALPEVREIAAAPRPTGTKPRAVAAGRIALGEVEHLDKAAAFAAAVLNDFAPPPGLAVDAALATRASVASPETEALDQAAHYSATVIDRFVDRAAARPAAGPASAPDGSAMSAAPLPASASAPQTLAAPALGALPASAAVSAVPAAEPPVPVAAASPPTALAAAPAMRAPSTPPRGMIEQVTPARIAAARIAPARAAPAPAPAPAAAPSASPSAVPAPMVAPAKPAPAPAALAAALPKPAPASAAPSHVEAPGFSARLLTRVDGRATGEVDFQQTPAGLKVRLGSVAEVLAQRLPESELARIRGSASGNAWLSLAELQAQGIPISYDPVYDEFNIGREDTRPRAARKVHIDQISTPERGAGAGTMDQIRRR